MNRSATRSLSVSPPLSLPVPPAVDIDGRIAGTACNGVLTDGRERPRVGHTSPLTCDFKLAETQ
ncbi:hypothetical protein ACFVU3_28510 [Streptomyces sp. NPDC058052]|uniref:hypothetical protein n=1 Tax=Streptomyces sp. NPDC058052 TaxID=3346316 RepID=UPI0036E258B8